MPTTPTIPRPVRTFQDEITGVTVHQLTDGPEQAGPLYFTRSSWTADGRYLIFLQQKNRSVNFYAVGPDGEVRQLTNLPPPPAEPKYTSHMHRQFRVEEGQRIMMRIPAMHPRQSAFVYAFENDLHWVDVEHGTDQVIYSFPRSDAEMPQTPLHTAFTADGKDLLLTTNRSVRSGEARIDPPEQYWDFGLRDESGYVSKIWRYDVENRRMVGEIFVSNGEQSHLLTCPWDPDLLLWLNYLHGCVYTMRRDGSNVRSFLQVRDVGMANHCSWDVARKRLIICLSDIKYGYRTKLASFDPATGDTHVYSGATLPHPCHPTVSPDGRWVVTDVADHPIGGTQGLHLLDQRADKLHPLCRCTWGALVDEKGAAVKSEFLHPNPNWSPDGRYVIFGTDFGSLVAQVYLADVSTLKGV